jgi:hypothetical protein
LNYLFGGSAAGGERTAAIYSLVWSAKLNGHNAEAFIRAVLERIADHPINRIHELPVRWLFSRMLARGRTSVCMMWTS